MTVQSDNPREETPLENAPLVLYAPRAPRSTRPVVGAHCGIPKHIYDLEPMGLYILIDAFFNQQPGQKVALNLNGQPDIVNTTTQSDSDTVTLYLPKKLLFPDFVNRLTYTVTRGSGNEETSEPLTLLYNAFRPGNEDTDHGVDGHSRLVLLLPDIIKNGVGPDFPDAGAQVCVSYPYCRAYDVIRLNCNGHDVVHTVTVSEAPQPGTDTPVTVCFTVTRADLARGGDSPQYVFSYTVTDQLGNGSDPDSPWSASQLVDVDLAGTRLPAPILREILNDSGDDPKNIDRDKLAGGPLWVIVLTSDPRFQVGDPIEVTYTAMIDGKPEVLVVPGIVEADEFGQKKPCVLQVPNEKVIAGSVVTVTYVLKKGGTEIASKTATAQVIGEGTITLDPPVPAANPVDPLAWTQGLTVLVAYAASLLGDKARLVLLNPMPGSPTFSELPLDANHRATFTLDAAFLGAWHGGAPQFIWVLIRDGKEIGESGPVVLNVNRIADGDPRLSMPVIAGQTGPELDVTKLVTGDKLTIAAWPLQRAGQYVWLRYDGYDSSGAPVFFDDLQGEAHNEAQGLTRAALVDWLKALKDGTTVTITFRVNFGKVADLAMAVSFPTRTYTVRATPALPELIVDTSLLILNGENFTFRYPWPYTGNDPVNTSANRAASGGVLPYTYESLNPKIATVDSEGVVRSEGNGRTTIWVRDYARQQKSFEVETANVTHIESTPAGLNLAAAKAYVSQVGGSMIPNSLTDRRLQIGAARMTGFKLRIGIIPTDNTATQITIHRNVGGSIEFSRDSLPANGSIAFDFWIS